MKAERPRTRFRAFLIAGPAAAAVAYIWMALGREASVLLGVIGPMALLGLAFAAIAAPITAAVLSSVEPSDEGLASGVNNAVSRVAQLVGVALAAGAASLAFGYEVGLVTAAAVSIAASLAVVATLPPVWAGQSALLVGRERLEWLPTTYSCTSLVGS